MIKSYILFCCCQPVLIHNLTNQYTPITKQSNSFFLLFVVFKSQGHTNFLSMFQSLIVFDNDNAD